MADNIYHKLRRITSSKLYFPEIDGIRFLAILLVILFHAHGYFMGKTHINFADNPDSYSLLNTLMINGDRGVELFFVLSGFILCMPFARQYISGGKKVQMKKYYLRRVTRLEPPYFIAMTGLLLLHLLMKTHPASTIVPSWLASLIYSHNVIYQHTPLLTVVAWSLEIEIQFYLLAPLLFRILSLGIITRRVILVGGIAAIVLLQTLLPDDTLTLYNFLQYFLIGILLADLHISDVAVNFFRKGVVALLSMLCLTAIIYLPIKNHKDAVSPEVLFISRLFFPFVVGLFYYVVLKNDTVKRVFSYKFVPILGGMCYSIYLLHYTIISIFGRLTIPIQITDYYLPNLFLQIALLLIPVTVLSVIFYYYIERPFMAGKWTDMLMKKLSRKTES